jgi:hypothetical protein
VTVDRGSPGGRRPRVRHLRLRRHHRAYRIDNSWGESWGVRGSAWITQADLRLAALPGRRRHRPHLGHGAHPSSGAHSCSGSSTGSGGYSRASARRADAGVGDRQHDTGAPMPDLWMPGATKLDIGDHAQPTADPPRRSPTSPGTRTPPPRSPSTSSPTRTSAATSPAAAGRRPAHPVGPLRGALHAVRARQLPLQEPRRQAGGTRTNRAGSVVIQIEALFFPYCRVGTTVYPRLTDTPCKGWAELQAWVHSWGVPNTWPMGRPDDFTSHRSASVWENHSRLVRAQPGPREHHQDPGSLAGVRGATPAAPDQAERSA